MFSTGIYAQKNSREITIYYFRELNQEEVLKIKELKNNLLTKNKKIKYTINFKNFYTDVVTKFEKDYDLFYLPKNIINGLYNNDQDVIIKLDSLNVPNKISYSTDLYTPYKTDEFCNNISDLTKKIKKIKSGNTLIIWLNGFLPNKYSTENIKKIYKQCIENGTEAILKPKIVNPKNFKKLIPDEEYYYIEFESIEYFNQYEILISFYDYSENKNKVIFNEILDFSKSGNKDFSIKKDENIENKCVLKIATHYLAMECYKLKNELNIVDVPEKESDCGDCKYLCLYNKEFSIKIRGYNDDFSSEELWSEKVVPFFFQCPR